jgi:hypothetical protein
MRIGLTTETEPELLEKDDTIRRRFFSVVSINTLVKIFFAINYLGLSIIGGIVLGF